jgi:hypothetical protein
MATITKPGLRNRLTTGLLALALAPLTAGVGWLAVATSAGTTTDPAPADDPTSQPCDLPHRAVNPNGPGALVSEQVEHWVTDEDRIAVNPNGPGAPASEHSIDGAC